MYGERIQTVLKIVVSLLALFVMCGVFFGWFTKTEDNTEATYQKSLDKMYTVYDKVEYGQPGKSAQLIRIQLTNPFTYEADFDAMIKRIVEKEKALYETKDKDLYAVEIDVYTRKYQFDNLLEPPFKAYYQHEDGWVASFDNRISWYRNHVYKDNFSEMIEPEDGDGKYFTDKEYKLFLRLLEWTAMSGDDSEAGIQHYLEFEKGLTENNDNYYETFDKYYEFINRGLSYGEPNMMFDGKGEYLIEYYSELDKRFKKYANANLL